MVAHEPVQIVARHQQLAGESVSLTFNVTAIILTGGNSCLVALEPSPPLPMQNEMPHLVRDREAFALWALWSWLIKNTPFIMPI